MLISWSKEEKNEQKQSISFLCFQCKILICSVTNLTSNYNHKVKVVE